MPSLQQKPPWISTCVTLAITTSIPKIWGKPQNPVGFFSDSEGHTRQIPMRFKISEWLHEQINMEFCSFNSNEATPAVLRSGCSSPEQATIAFPSRMCVLHLRTAWIHTTLNRRQCKKATKKIIVIIR